MFQAEEGIDLEGDSFHSTYTPTHQVFWDRFVGRVSSQRCLTILLMTVSFSLLSLAGSVSVDGKSISVLSSAVSMSALERLLTGYGLSVLGTLI